MGAGIVGFVWLFVAVIYGAFWVAFLSLFIHGRRKKSRALSWLGGAPLALSTLGIFVALGATVYGFVWNSRPANIYQLSFSSSPPPDVTGLQSYNYAFADTSITFLKFRATPNTIAGLTSKGWSTLTGQKLRNEDFSYFAGDSRPDWWNPAKSESTQIFVAHNRFGNFASEEEILIYEPTSQQTHYALIGID